MCSSDLWRLLTDNGYAAGDSPGFPRASRVLLVLANALVGVVFAALLALRGGAWALDLRQAESIGDTIVGFPLVLALMFSGLTLAVRGGGVSGGGGSVEVEDPAQLLDHGGRVDPPRAEPAG